MRLEQRWSDVDGLVASSATRLAAKGLEVDLGALRALLSGAAWLTSSGGADSPTEMVTIKHSAAGQARRRLGRWSVEGTVPPGLRQKWRRDRTRATPSDGSPAQQEVGVDDASTRR